MNNKIKIWKQKLNNTIKKIEEKEKKLKEKYNNIIFYSNTNNVIINAYNMKKQEKIDSKIAMFYKNEYFINSRKKYDIFLFITFTFNPKYNNLENEEEDNIIKNITKQKELIQKELSNINKTISNKKLKIDYIMVKELTKNLNIHLHSLYKVKKYNLNEFINIIKNTQKKGVFSRIEIVIENENDLDFYLKEIQITKIKDFNIVKLNKKETNASVLKRYKSGKFLYIKKSEGLDNVTSYILKYINKNNNKTLEHKILNYFNIKKITFKAKKIKIHKEIDYYTQETKAINLQTTMLNKLIRLVSNKLKKEENFKNIFYKKYKGKIIEEPLLQRIYYLLKNGRIFLLESAFVLKRYNKEYIISNNLTNHFNVLNANNKEDKETIALKNYLDLVKYGSSYKYLSKNKQEQNNDYLMFKKLYVFYHSFLEEEIKEEEIKELYYKTIEKEKKEKEEQIIKFENLMEEQLNEYINEDWENIDIAF